MALARAQTELGGAADIELRRASIVHAMEIADRSVGVAPSPGLTTFGSPKYFGQRGLGFSFHA